MTVEHVHAQMIRKLQFYLYALAGREIPGFLHGLVCITGATVATQALLRHVMNVHRVRLCRWVREDPLLSRAEHRVCVDAIWIKA